MIKSSGDSTMKKHTLNLTAISIIASLTILPAFAAQQNTDLVKNKTVIIEQNESKYAKVTDIKIIQNDTGSTITGKVALLSKNNPARHRAIPGHVDISIVDNNGNTNKLASVHYNKISIKSRYAKFSYKLANTPKSGSKLVIAHNDKNHN